MSELKTCNKCGVVKHLSEFYTYPGGAYRASCKQCALEYQNKRNKKVSIEYKKMKEVNPVKKMQIIAVLAEALHIANHEVGDMMDIDSRHNLINVLIGAIYEISLTNDA